MAPRSKKNEVKVNTFRLVCRFSSYFWRNFFENNCMQHATALSYTTLLSLVPLMAVMLSIFTAFPVFEDISVQIQNFVFENFVPTSGEVVQKYIQEFSDNASKLTGQGILVLMLTSLMMMATIDKSLNTMWHSSKPRRAMSRFMVYWSVLTLGPILIGVSLAISSYVLSLPLLSETASYGRKLGLLITLPFFMETLAFTLLYIIVPNCRVSFRPALVGGAVAALLFELAKQAFSLYITNFPTYETIYGAMATVPVFLIWIFFSWAITLIGAEFTWCLTTFCHTSDDESQRLEKHDLTLAYQLLYRLWLAQKKGETLSTDTLLSCNQNADQKSLSGTLESLADNHLVIQNEQGNWLISHDMTNYRLADLYRTSSFQLSAIGLSQKQVTTGSNTLWSEIDKAIGDKMDIPLADLFKMESAQE